MKVKAKYYYFKKKQKKLKIGFTIIETLVSLLLLSMAILILSKSLISAIDTTQKSKIRFKMFQRRDYYKNQILAKPFDSVDLEEGKYSEIDPPFKINWKIKKITSSLKVINFSISYKQLKNRSYFYKSQFIKNPIL